MKTLTKPERADASRNAILSATVELLAERGYTGTTFAIIGERTGLSRGLVTHYFGTKDKCVAAVVEHIRNDLTKEYFNEQRLRGLATIDQLIDGYLMQKGRRNTTSLAMYSIIVESLTTTPSLHPTVLEHDRLLHGTICNALKEARSTPESPSDENAGNIATYILGALRGVSLQWLTDPSSLDLKKSAALLKQTIRHNVS